MQRVNGFYLFTGGRSLRPLADFKNTTKYSEAQIPLYVAQGWLEPVVLGNTIFQLRTSWAKGDELLRAITDAIGQIQPALSASPQEDSELGWILAYRITSALSEFETVLGAEWAISDLFLVTKLPGYDITELIERGIVLFPADLQTKVPEIIDDANQFGKCLAFRLPSAAGFHLHRINEAVLARYYDVITKGKPRPKTGTIGAYLKLLDKYGVGNAKVLAALDSLRSLHRNPLLHPRESLQSVDEAMSLYGAIQSVMVHMLKVIPALKAITLPAPTTSSSSP